MHHKDWITGFTEACKDTGIPSRYLLWVGIHILASALSRRCYVTNVRGSVVPNLYILLIGPPNSGKSQSTELAMEFHAAIKTPLASENVTLAALIDELERYKRLEEIEGELTEYHELCMVTDEIVETIKGYDLQFLQTLSKLWDAPNWYRENKRSFEKPKNIRRPCFNGLFGVQPILFNHQFHDEAWQGGFLTRTIIVFIEEKQKKILFPVDEPIKTHKGRPIEFKSLCEDLHEIKKIRGEVPTAITYREEYVKWVEEGEFPKPNHPKLIEYCARREHILIKLSLVSCISRHSSVLEDKDFLRAREWLEETELNLVDVFKSIARTKDSEVLSMLRNMLIFEKQGEWTPEPQVKRYLAMRTPVYNVNQLLEVAVDGGFIEKKIQSHESLGPTLYRASRYIDEEEEKEDV